MKKLFFLFLFGVILIESLLADRVENQPVTIEQPWGQKIQLFITGDEYFNYLHDRYGYTIIQSNDGVYRFAVSNNGVLESSPFVVGKDNPLLTALKPYATISADEYERKKYAFLGMSEREYKSAFMMDDVALFQTGDFNNIVIVIRFSDSPPFVGENAMNNLFNREGASSVKDYYNKVSYGQLKMNSHFVPRKSDSTLYVYNAPNSYAYYNESNASRIELFNGALSHINSTQSSISVNVDKDNNGRIDNVTFLLNHSRNTAWGTPLWPHKSYYSGGRKIFNKSVGTYYLAYTGDGYTTHVHEMFHVLSAPDLYHYTSNGIQPAGSWDLMNSGGGHMLAYMKMRYGKWIPDIPQLTQSGQYWLKSVGKSSQSAYYVKPNPNKNELFYLEYRNAADDIYENRIPGSGIIFYRVDPKLNGNAQGPPDMLYVFRPGGTPLVNGNVSRANFSSNVKRTVFDPGTDPNPAFQDGSVAEFRVHSIGSVGGDSISFIFDFDRITNFKVTGHGEDFISLGWDKEDSVIVVCSRKPIAGAPEKGQNYKVGDVISDGSQVVYLGSGDTFTMSDLLPSSFYYYRIWIIDTEYNSFIGSADTKGFTNYPLIVDKYPFSTSFEQDTISKLPTGFKGFPNIDNGVWSASNELARTGSMSLRFGVYISNMLAQSTFEADLRTMAFRMQSGRKYTISYDFKARFNESSRLKISKNSDGTTLQVLQANNFTDTQWKRYSVDFVADADTIYYIYFGVKAYQGFGGYFDNFSVETESPVAEPDNLFATFVNDSTVNLTWNEKGSATKWEIKYGPKGFDPLMGGITINNISSETLQVTHLKPAHAYSWYVRAVTPETYSYWAGPGNFTTKHPDTKSYLSGYYEPFDSVEIPGLPSYWRTFLFEGDQVWGSDQQDENNIARLQVFDKQSESWMVSRPINISSMSNPHLSFMQTSFGFDRTEQKLMVSMDYDGLGNPKDFTWEVLDDSIYEYKSMYHLPVSLDKYKTARTLFLGWRMKAVKGGINFWEIDQVSVSDLFEITLQVTNSNNAQPVADAQILDVFGNVISVTNPNGIAQVPMTYQKTGFSVTHERFEKHIVGKQVFDGAKNLSVALVPRNKVQLKVVANQSGESVSNAKVSIGSNVLYTDNSGSVEFYADANKVLSLVVSGEGYNNFELNQLITADVNVQARLTRPVINLQNSNIDFGITWADTVITVVVSNTGDGPANWYLNNDFSSSAKAYSGISDEPDLWCVVSSKANNQRNYLIRTSLNKPDSVSSFLPLNAPFTSLTFDNNFTLYGITQFGRYIVKIDKTTGKSDTIVDGIVSGLRFDEVIINRYKGNMFVLGGDPYNANDKHIYSIDMQKGTAVKITDLAAKDNGFYFTGYSDYIMSSFAATGGSWKIRENGTINNRYPRSLATSEMKTSWDGTLNKVVIYSDVVSYQSKQYAKLIGAFSSTSGAYVSLGALPDSLVLVSLATSSRLNDWYAPLAYSGTVQAGSTDTVRIRVYNDIPVGDNMVVKGIITTEPNAGVHEFTVNASLRGYTSIKPAVPAGIKVYPNPSASGSFTIEGIQGILDVYSVQGRKLKTYDLSNGNTIKVDNHGPGIYIVKHRQSGYVFRIEIQ